MAYYNGKDTFAIQTILKGDKGEDGQDGLSPFIRYSASADGEGFTETWSVGQNYVGIATAREAPTDKSAYQWVKLNNVQGDFMQRLPNPYGVVKCYREQPNNAGTSLIEARIGISGEEGVSNLAIRGSVKDTKHPCTFEISPPELDPSKRTYSEKHPVTVGVFLERLAEIGERLYSLELGGGGGNSNVLYGDGSAGILYSFKDNEYYVIGSEKTSGELTVASKIMYIPVTSITPHAFSNCDNITKLTVSFIGTSANASGHESHLGAVFGGTEYATKPEGSYHYFDTDSNTYYIYNIPETLKSAVIREGITTIGRSAFRQCYSLTDITLPDSVTSIEKSAFAYCSGLKNINIPSGVKRLEEGTFGYCTSLERIELPDSVTSIGDKAFYACSNLSSITIPNNVTSIGEWAFAGCPSITSITIPNSVTSIGDNAFYGCTGLTSITIPNSVTTIGDEAFEECRSLTSITIPDSVTAIGENAFHYCSELDSVYITDLAKWCDISFGESNMATPFANPLWNGATLYLNGEFLDHLAIPEGITEIKPKTFAGCSSIVSVTMPDSVTFIDRRAFRGCGNLESVIIGNNVTGIQANAFDSCTRLESITIPVSVTAIGAEAFYFCESLADVYYKGTETQWNNIAMPDGTFEGATIHFNSV